MMPEKRPYQPQAKPTAETVISAWDEKMAKEKVTLKGMWTSMGDLVRDVDTANKMAKDKFEGDTALMHVARGAVTTGVGAGLEKAMGYVWDSVWSGEIPFYDKSKFNPAMAEAMNTYALDSNKKARLTYFIKESTQDLSTAVFYNFLAFRGQPLLPRVDASHLVRSLGIDAAEAFLAPTVPMDMQDRAHASQAKIADAKIQKLKQDIGNDLRSAHRKSEEKLDGKGYDIITSYEFDTDLTANRALLESARNEKILHEAADRQYDPKQHKKEHLIRSFLDKSNPVTLLGADWMIDGVLTLVRNVRAVRKVRAEKGGLEGKKVFMPKEDRYHRDDRGGDRKPWDRGGSRDRKPWDRGDQSDRKPWEKKWQGQDRQQERPPQEEPPEERNDKVYYGNSKVSNKSADEQKLEEYELKGS